MSKIIRFGIIGCGMVAELHIRSLQKIDIAEVGWICDSSESRLKDLLGKYRIKKGGPNYSLLLKEDQVDAVIICTPPNTHFSIAIDVIRARKHVLIEKPIVTNLEDAHKLLTETLGNPDLVIMDCSARHSRLHPKYNYIKNIIDSGELGEIYSIHHKASYRQSRPGIEYHPEATWFGKKQFSGGGPLIDWGVYDLGFHLGILGDKHELTSLRSSSLNGLDIKTYQNKDFDVEEHAIVFMEFNKQLVYFWERASNAHNENYHQTHLYGTKGGLKFNYLTWEDKLITHYYLNTKNEPKEKLLDFPIEKHISHLDDFFTMDQHFINCILNIEKSILPISSAVNNLKIIFKCMENRTYTVG